MATLDDLKTYYANVMRVGATAAPSAHQTLLANLAGQVDSGLIGLAAAQTGVARLSIDTTSVASLAYNFFTGATPTQAGLDYLVSPAGPNLNNLNSAYYQSFDVENRYINFAVNLGKLGEGSTRFAADYGGLNLRDALVKAYNEIFGAAPDAAKINAILGDQVPNGVGGTYARAEYFAFYGRDGAGGVGTKAAMVGWLIAEAEKADTGAYAQANANFLADLGPDGVASFNTGLIGRYGGTPGGAIAFAPSQSVSLTATDPLLRATDGNDTLTGAGLERGQVLSTGGGNDVIIASGTISGSIDAGAGADTVTIGGLAAASGDDGRIRLGDGADTLTVNGLIAIGAGLDGGAGEDTLIAGFAFSPQTTPDPTQQGPAFAIVNFEHLVLTRADPQSPIVNLAGTGFQDITIRGTGGINAAYIPAQITQFRAEAINAGDVGFNFAGRFGANPTAGDGRPLRIYTTQDADLTLDAVQVAAGKTLNVSVNAETLRLHLLNDTAVTSLTGPGKIVVSGAGRLVAGSATGSLDASQAVSVEIGRWTGIDSYLRPSTAVLSANADHLGLDLASGPLLSGRVSVTLGGGADTLGLYQSGGAYRFANLRLDGGVAGNFVQVTDFAKGVDRLELGAGGGAVASVTGSVGAAASLEQALTNVSAGLALNTTGVFEYGGDTYLYRQDGAAGLNTGDGLIRLVGVSGLSVGTAAGADIHYS